MLPCIATQSEPLNLISTMFVLSIWLQFPICGVYAPPFMTMEAFWSVSSCMSHEEALTGVVKVKVSCSGGVRVMENDVSCGCAVCDDQEMKCV